MPPLSPTASHTTHSIYMPYIFPRQNSYSAPSNSGSSTTPSLFFIALGIGVVFINLWLIIGIKYCCRHRRRARYIIDNENTTPNGGIVMLNIGPESRRKRERRVLSVEVLNKEFPVQPFEAQDLALDPKEVMSKDTLTEDIESKELCSICLENFEPNDQIRILKCGHKYHDLCIFNWLTKRKAICPLCKMDLFHLNADEGHNNSDLQDQSFNTPINVPEPAQVRSSNIETEQDDVNRRNANHEQFYPWEVFVRSPRRPGVNQDHESTITWWRNPRIYWTRRNNNSNTVN